MINLGKQLSNYSAFKIVKGIPVPFILSADASNLLNSNTKNYYFSILLISFIGCGVSVLIVIFYYYLTHNFTSNNIHLYSISIILMLGPFVMLSAIAYHHLYRIWVRSSENRGLGYVIALDNTDKVSGETISKRALISLVYNNEVYLLMSYSSSINISIGEIVYVSWRKNNAKLCWIHNLITL